MMEAIPAVVFDNVSFAYHSHVSVLANLSLVIPKGQFVGIAGCNGAGKSTLLRLINVLLRPEQGQVYVNGTDTRRLSPAQAALHVGTVFQNPNHQLFLETIEGEVAYGLINRRISDKERTERIEAALDVTGLQDLRKAFPRSLSLGMRQRIALASVLALEPDVILLDEPTTGMDYRETERLLQIIKQQEACGKTIILITHDLELLLDYAERVILLGGGNVIADGIPQTVFARHEDVIQTQLLPPDMVRFTYGLQCEGVRTTCCVEETADQVADLLQRDGGRQHAG
jgi:energy-coupling factor transport system ATP-binding protein